MSSSRDQRQSSVWSNFVSLAKLVATFVIGAFQLIWALMKGIVMLVVTLLSGFVSVNIKAAVVSSVLNDKLRR